MKKLLSLTLTILIATACAFLVACEKDPLVIKDSDNLVVVTADTDESLSLIDYINTLDEFKDMFVIENGMVTAIDGVKNAADWSKCWMIYTSDSEMANVAWGQIEYKGEIYGSAIVGAEQLIVKKGCIYIFVYQSF
jgi:hypothetical protein